MRDRNIKSTKLRDGPKNQKILAACGHNLNFASSADGIDSNNGDRMVVRNTYVHDVSGADEYNTGRDRVTPPASFGAPSIEIAQKGYHDYESHTTTSEWSEVAPPPTP